MNGKDENACIQRILNGETELFSLILDRYSRPLYSMIVQMVSSPEDAEELLQDVFLKVFRSLASFRGDAAFSTWIYRIAYNLAISFTRKRRIEYLYIEESIINNVPDDMAGDSLFADDSEERLGRLLQAVELLSAEERALISLFYYDGKPVGEIGEILKLTVSNVKVKLHRTRKKMYVLMKEK